MSWLLQVVKKHAKNFVLIGDDRHKVLEGIFYKNDGSIYITNKHILLHVKNVHDYKDSIILHYSTNKPIKGNYPKVDQLFNWNFKHEITLNLKKIAPYLETLKVSNLIGDIGILKDDLVFEVTGQMGESYILTLDGKSDGFSPVLLQSMYLYYCLKFFNDLNVDSVRVELSGSYTPLLFSNFDKSVQILISPVRRY